MEKSIKKIIGTIFLTVAVALAVNGQTNVSGFISANTTWNTAGSPYIVIGNILVSHGYTLTIEPGVIVKFNADKALQIDGELVAVGTESNRIIFTSNQPNPAPGDWAKIHFPDISNDAVFDISGAYLSGCIMKYCDILFAGSLGFGAVHNQDSGPYLSQCKIVNSASCGVYSAGVGQSISCSRIDSSLIKDCLDYGIYINSYSTTLSITSDTLENNNGGIYTLCNNYTDTLPKTIRNNYFLSNYGDRTLTLRQSVQNMTVSDNYFLNNTSEKIFVYSADGSYQYVTINCNHFLNNHSDASIFYSDYPIIGSINNNIFDGNISTTGSIFDIITQNNGFLFFIENNLFQNNTSTNGPCFTFTLTPSLSLKYNQVINNTATSAMYLISYTNGNGFKYNYFENPNCQYELYNNTPYGQTNITADSNYWGSTNTQDVDLAIYDYFDFANQSVVYYSPILTSPPTVNTSCPIVPTGINNFEATHSSFTLFPIPASKELTIIFDKIINTGKIELFNIIGKEIFNENIYYASQKEINVGSIANGFYLLKLFDGERYYCKKIIVRHY